MLLPPFTVSLNRQSLWSGALKIPALLFEKLPYAAIEADYQALLPQTGEPAQPA
jgi:hypothetical protein